MSGLRSVICVLALCLLAGSALGQVQSFDTVFPYCDCVRPMAPNSSPYTISASPRVSTTTDGSTKMCWSLTAKNTATGRCAKFDLRKIEVNMKTECRGSIKSLTFGNQVIAPSYTYYPIPKTLVFKVTRGGATNLASLSSLVGKTTQVCITLIPGSTCNRVGTFCRRGVCDYAFFSPDNKCCPGNSINVSPPIVNNASPPPVLPPVAVTPFPYCACDRASASNSYSLSPSSSAPIPTTSAGRNTYCWDLSATRYSGSATSCVNFDLKKIEWDINTGCQNSVTSTTLDGEIIAASYSRYPNQGLTYKVTRGSSNLSSLGAVVSDSKRLCITLGGSCPTLSSFCKTPFCRVAFFSPNNKCCPLQSLVNAS